MKRFLTLSHLRLAFEVLMILAVLAAALSRFAPSRAADTPSQDAPTAVYWYVCNTPTHVGLFLDRVHIYCSTTSPVGGAPALSSAIHWFAVPTTTDSATASRFMSLLQTAMITAKPIWVFVDPNDTSGASFGCAAGDCRRLYGMEMR